MLGDFDGSGTCGVGDLVVFNKYWNAGDARADMNGDCAVDVADVSMIYNYYYPLGDATIVDFNLNGTAGDDSGDFLAAWLVGNPRCNVDGDCDVDNDDLVLWFDWVYAGCP